MNTLYCAKCGSTDVQIMAWVDANTNEYRGDVNDPLELKDCWCETCKDHAELLTIRLLWNRFAEIPVNNDDEIEEPFLNFEAGTCKFDVWHWFDKRCPHNLYRDLMYIGEK
ncbi:hypothetical protein [Palleniella muris]|uniref:hypothetical protein n=1 Tax=Palleniella muris TaxID=3038145 RepID=UPI00240F708F|nr:hypothetical protein [Palleniella muris]